MIINRSSDYFATIPSIFEFGGKVSLATGPQGVPFKQIQRIKELVLCAYIVVKTENVVTSCCFAEDNAELFL